MTHRNSVLVAGSANLDFVVRAAHIPAPGETVLGRDFATFPGGKGANQAVACAKAGGAPTRMLLALGDDAFAQPIEASLHEAGVVCEVVRSDDRPTGVAFICLSDDAENAITVAPGANSTLREEHLPSLAGVSHLLLQLETPLEATLAWTKAARRDGVRVVLNAAPARDLPAELLSHVDLLIVNEGELRMLAGTHGNIAAALSRMTVADVVVTLGARGCCARVEGKFLLQPGFEVEPVDTTGAGDTFCGALVAALSQGSEMATALRRASAAAALACTRLGAQTGVPSSAEVDAFLQSQASPPSTDRLARYCGLSVAGD